MRSARGNVAFYDAVADDWADAYRMRHAGGQMLRERRERALAMLEGKVGRLLDIGCGSGAMAAEIVSRELEFYGVDASQKMIQAGRAVFAGADGAKVCAALAEAIPFRDASFDVAICLGVIGAVGDRDLAIAEARRVLRRGGTLLISFSNRTSPYSLWKGYVLYPCVKVLGGLASRVLRRPENNHRRSRAALFTATSSAKLLRRYGLSVQQVSYYNFNILLSPLDEFFGLTAGRLVERLAGLASSRLRPLGAGFIARAVVED